MYKFTLFVGICSAFTSGLKAPAKHPMRKPVADNKSEQIVGCYYINNEGEQVDPTLDIEMIDVSLCTHLYYDTAYVGKNASVILLYECTDCPGMKYNSFERVNNLRKRNRRFKILVPVEEALKDENNKEITNKIFFDPILREKLVNNIVDFVQNHKLNGIELQSQHLAGNNAAASDKQNFVLLLKSLKEKFDRKGLILALAVDSRESTANKYNIEEISKYVSFINLMAYNFHGDRTYDTRNIVKAGHIAPLYHSPKENTEDQKSNVDYIVKYWLSKGTPPNKLILGTTFTGLEYNLANPKRVGRDAPVVEDPKYSLPQTSYYYTCPWEKTRSWTTVWDKEQQVPYISKRERMIAYESVASIKLKAEYAKKMKLGGVFADSIDGDDFSGHCGGEKFPLLSTLSRVLRDKC